MTEPEQHVRRAGLGLRRVFAIAALAQLLHLFSVSVTRGALALFSFSAERIGDLAGHAALAFVLAVAWELCGRRPAPLRLVRIGVLLVGLASLVLSHRYGFVLSADGAQYFVVARSAVFDRDLDFRNDYERVQASGPPRAERCPVGMPLLSAPLLLTAHGLLRLGQALGLPFVADGFGYPYERAYAWTSYVVGTAGLWLCLRLALLFYPAGLAALSVLTIWLGSFLSWYTIVEPSMTHAAAAATAAGMWLVWLERRPLVRMRDFALLGAVAGLAAMVRWQNGLLLLLPLADAWLGSRRWRGPLLSAAVAAVCFLPQWLFWAITAGNALALPTQDHAVRWARLNLWEVLYSTNRGLFPWNPVLYAAALGLLLWLRRSRRLGILFLAAFLIQVYVNGSVQIWWGGWSFGGRRFDGLIALFVLGLLALFGWLLRHAALMLVAACLGLGAWHLGLVEQARSGAVAPDDLVSFEDVSRRTLGSAYRNLGHPFAAPANWIFAWRYGVPPSRFDKLFGHDGFNELRLVLDDAAEYALGSGWSPTETDRDGQPYRWVVGLEARLLIPLSKARDYEVTIEGRSYRWASPNAVSLVVNGHRYPARALSVDQPLRWSVPASAWSPKLNELRLSLAKAVRPADVVASTDERLLSAAIYSIELRPREP